VLGQEREVLAIEVLAAQGNAAAAKRRAQAFIAAYPKSPHSATLARFVAAPERARSGPSCTLRFTARARLDATRL